jgi:hypothetical protein
MVSICGGEPLIYPHIEALVKGLLDQAGSFTSAPTPCLCAGKCAIGWHRRPPGVPSSSIRKSTS